MFLHRIRRSAPRSYCYSWLSALLMPETGTCTRACPHPPASSTVDLLANWCPSHPVRSSLFCGSNCNVMACEALGVLKHASRLYGSSRGTRVLFCAGLKDTH